MSSSLRCCALAASLFLVVPAEAQGLANLDARTTAGPGSSVELDDPGARQGPGDALQQLRTGVAWDRVDSVGGAGTQGSTSPGRASMRAWADYTGVTPWTAAAEGAVRWTDRLTLDGAGLTGRVGRIVVAFHVGGPALEVLGPNPSAFDHGQAAAEVLFGSSIGNFSQNVGVGDDGIEIERHAAGLDDVGRQVLDPDPDGSYTAVLTTDIVWGQTLDLTISAWAQVHASGDESFRSTIDMSNAVWWDGVLSASVEGQAVDDFTVTSTSGLDFRRSYGLTPAVPEPATWALMVLGAGLLRARTRRARERGEPLSPAPGPAAR